jgi:hypothetical protein
MFDYVIQLLQSGLGNLAAYLAAHVLLCLVPAFFIAGGLTALVPRESITRFLGRRAPKIVAYPAATAAGSLLAVCSCTILPLFAGIYKKGAGLGPAITFLFFAPAANILALTYTGAAIGSDFAFARLFLSLVFGIGIGLIMALIFRREDILNSDAAETGFIGTEKLCATTVAFLLFLVALLLFGTLKLDFLTRTYASFTVPLPGIESLQQSLHRLVPFDAAKGEEGVTTQGALLIVLLALIAGTAWRGLGKVHEGFTGLTWSALILVGFTLTIAALGLEPTQGGLNVHLTGKLFGVVSAQLALVFMARRFLQRDAVQQWLWETWRFVRQIFPLLIVGVFAVGIIRWFIKPEWIEAVAGTNNLWGNLAAVFFGVFMYFPTLVEVPIAKMFLDLGMHKGPLIAYLMADPELSLQSILITATIIGRQKAWVYVGWVALFSTVSGLIYGAWVDGVSVVTLMLYLVAFLATLAAVLYAVSRRRQIPKEYASHADAEREQSQIHGGRI